MRVWPKSIIRMTEGSARKAARPMSCATLLQPIMSSTWASGSSLQASRLRLASSAQAALKASLPGDSGTPDASPTGWAPMAPTAPAATSR